MGMRGMVINNDIATSGACATIASDALMNPFDGGLHFQFLRCAYLIGEQ